MSKKIQLDINQPCHEDWQKMTDSEKGKFCGSCQKQVIDFTGMNDQQLIAFFRKPSTGSVCGRFMSDQLQREIIIPKKRKPWFKYFFQFALPAFVLSLKASANEMIKYKPKTDIEVSPYQSKQASVSTNFSSSFAGKLIEGTVTDEQGAPLQGASVVIRNTSIATSTNSQGKFVIDYNGSETQLILDISYIGFMAVERSIDLSVKNSSYSISVQMQYVTMGEVVVVMGMIAYTPQPTVPLIKMSESKKNPLRLYPNPALPGSDLKISFSKKLDEGNYSISVYSVGGAMVDTRNIKLDGKNSVLDFKLPTLSEGNYFLQVHDQKRNKSYSEAITIR